MMSFGALIPNGTKDIDFENLMVKTIEIFENACDLKKKSKFEIILKGTYNMRNDKRIPNLAS